MLSYQLGFTEYLPYRFFSLAGCDIDIGAALAIFARGPSYIRPGHCLARLADTELGRHDGLVPVIASNEMARLLRAAVCCGQSTQVLDLTSFSSATVEVLLV